MSTAQESGSWSRVYNCDPYGNRWVSANHPLAFATPTAQSQFDAANNRLTKTFDGTPLPADAYDVAGNLSKHAWVGAMAHDANNLQRYYCASAAATCTASNANAEYQYDGDGRRVKKLQGSRTTVFVYDAFGNLAAEYDTQPAPNLVADTYYRTTDHLGSTRLVTDGSGAVVSRRDFFPFGEEIPANATFGNRQLVTDGGLLTTYNNDFGVYQKFTGKERDGESGLDYFGARFLSSTTARFTTVDPSRYSTNLANPQSWHRYAYALGNPNLHVDPNGLWSERVHSDLLRAAFPGLSASELQIMINANNKVDAPINQVSFDKSCQHGMSDGLRGESLQASEARASSFIETHKQAARAAFLSANQGILPRGRVTFSNEALAYFGYLQHTETDKFAPSHAGYQAWSPVDAIIHLFGSKHMRLDDNPSRRQFEIATGLLKRAFLDTFGPKPKFKLRVT